MTTSRVKPGDVLGGKYRVERILGAGGMGIVVAAKHIDLGQRVAVKFMLKETLSDVSHAERFLREAKAAVQLKSVHTARVLDVGRLKNDDPFMVMEYLEGRDLDAELHAQGPLPPHTAVDYILQTCEALAEAHGLGMIHRDVKLKNLFLTRTVDGRPLVKVLDFGLAKTLGAHNDVSLTATNSVFGSPQYMSPEQMKSAKDVDFRSDIWSLGVCLYELITGRVPYDAAGVAEICAMVLKDPVPAPSQFAPGLPADLEDVILRCLEKDMSLRYQSVAELAFALQNYSADEGSARRILHVMQTAQKIEHPTIMTNPGVPIDAGPKTMNAWDSGVPATRRTTRLTRAQMMGGIGFFIALGLIGVMTSIVALHRERATSITGTVQIPSSDPTTPLPPPSTAETAASPMPAAAPTAVGTVIGASPTPDPPSDLPPAPSPAEANGAPPNHAMKTPPRGRPPASPPTHAAPPVAKTPPAPTPTPAPTPRTKPKNGPGSGADYM